MFIYSLAYIYHSCLTDLHNQCQTRNTSKLCKTLSSFPTHDLTPLSSWSYTEENPQTPHWLQLWGKINVILNHRLLDILLPNFRIKSTLLLYYVTTSQRPAYVTNKKIKKSISNIDKAASVKTNAFSLNKTTKCSHHILSNTHTNTRTEKAHSGSWFLQKNTHSNPHLTCE